MGIFSKIGKFAAAVLAGLTMTAMAADDIYPPLDTDLNDFDPTVPVGRYIQQISSNTVNEVVILTNGVLTVGGESINLAEETNEVYKSAVAYVDGATNEIGSIIRPLQVIPELIPDQTSPTNQLADKAWVDKKVESVAAYYITADAEGNAFESYAALANTTVYYSGGMVRVPTRNDYAVVLADETHGGTEWRYIYAMPDGASSGQWEAQYPIETNDYEALSNKPEINGHTLTNNQTGADLGLLDLAGGTMTGEFRVGATFDGNFQVVPEKTTEYDYIPPTMRFSDGAGVVGIIWRIVDGVVVMDVSDVLGTTYRIAWPSASGTLALAAPNPTAGNIAVLDPAGNPTDSGLSTTNVVTLAYDVNSNRTAVTVGVPRQNDPSSEVDTSAVDEATGRYITVPEVVGPHSLAITGGEDEESDPSERTVASGEGAIAANKGVATNRFSVALGYHTFAAGEAAVSHGYETSALGSHSHSEGHDSQARGTFSHAEGEGTFVSGYAAHAEGFYNGAYGNYSHAEGYGSEAHGAYSHAAGFDSQTTAEAWYAHSDGIGTRATNHTAYVWQGATNSSNGPNPQPTVRGLYYSHGLGTYNINPNGGLAGFWVGESNLVQHINAALAAELTNKLDYKVSGERCTASGTWCVNDGIMGTDIIFSTGAFSESTTPNNNINNGSYITFNPSYFGMSNYETIQKFTVRARSNSGGGWPGNFVGYARILNAADLNTVLAVSEQFTVSNFNQIVEIGLKPHVLLDTNNTYMIQFVTSLDSQTLAENIPLRLVTGSTSPLCYVNGNTSWKPIMTVDHFMSISGQMQAILAALQSGNFNTIHGIADTMSAMSSSAGISASQVLTSELLSSRASIGSGSTALYIGSDDDLQGD